MTEKEFNEQSWYRGMIAIYKDQECMIVSIDFDEMLIGIILDRNRPIDANHNEIKWVRAENCKLKTE